MAGAVLLATRIALCTVSLAILRALSESERLGKIDHGLNELRLSPFDLGPMTPGIGTPARTMPTDRPTLPKNPGDTRTAALPVLHPTVTQTGVLLAQQVNQPQATAVMAPPHPEFYELVSRRVQRPSSSAPCDVGRILRRTTNVPPSGPNFRMCPW